MKLDTQRDRWQAVLDGAEIVNSYGTRFKMDEHGYVVTFLEGSWVSSSSALYGDDGWQLYEPANEPPKPENKVIFVYHLPDADRYYVSGSEAPYINENDAIRAAMEWIGEKARRLRIKSPTWVKQVVTLTKSDEGALEWLDYMALELALLMRWPIEILEEV